MNPKTGLITMGGAIRRFDNFNLKEWLEAETGLPVAIENDANCALKNGLVKGKIWMIFFV
ncbi:Beta-glucoside kinase [Listeria monocytogenes N53-1]|nr:Beta-glucoside kinase [Listeria monocytogenes N53-1]